MTNKTLAIISYITIIGWIAAYLEYKKMKESNPLVSYHLGQSLGIIIFSVALAVVTGIVASVIPSLGIILSVAGLLPLVLIIFGIIAANNESNSPIPGIGKFFEGKFDFINQ